MGGGGVVACGGVGVVRGGGGSIRFGGGVPCRVALGCVGAGGVAVLPRARGLVVAPFGCAGARFGGVPSAFRVGCVGGFGGLGFCGVGCPVVGGVCGVSVAGRDRWCALLVGCCCFFCGFWFVACVGGGLLCWAWGWGCRCRWLRAGGLCPRRWWGGWWGLAGRWVFCGCFLWWCAAGPVSGGGVPVCVGGCGGVVGVGSGLLWSGLLCFRCGLWWGWLWFCVSAACCGACVCWCGGGRGLRGWLRGARGLWWRSWAAVVGGFSGAGAAVGGGDVES